MLDRPVAGRNNPRRLSKVQRFLRFEGSRAVLASTAMPSYLVETFLPRGTAGGRSASVGRARSAAEALTQRGTSVRFDRAIHVPEDEICFFIFDAPSSRDAVLVAHVAELDPIRVVEAVSATNSDRAEER